MYLFKHKVTKLMIACFVFTILVSSSITYLAFAVNPTVTIGAGTPVLGLAYSVYKQGSIYYFRNGLTGAIDNSTINLAYELNLLMVGHKGTYRFDIGNYSVSQNIVLQDNIDIEGSGNLTKFYPSSTSVTVFSGTNNKNIVLNNFWIKGFGSGSSSDIYLIGLTHSSITNLKITNAGQHGLYLQTNCYYNKIIGNEASYNGYSGIALSGGTGQDNFNIISGNIASFNGWHGIQIGESETSNIISYNICNSNGALAPSDGSGIIINSAYFTSVIGNTLSGNINAGIWLEDVSSFNTISGNTINFPSTAYGIMLYQGSNNAITGNTLFGSGAGSTDGIILYNPDNGKVSQQNVIDGNSVYGAGRDGIHITGNGANDFNIISNNKIMDSHVHGILIDSGVGYTLIIGDYTKGTVGAGIVYALYSGTQVHNCFNETVYIT